MKLLKGMGEGGREMEITIRQMYEKCKNYVRNICEYIYIYMLPIFSCVFVSFLIFWRAPWRRPTGWTHLSAAALCPPAPQTVAHPPWRTSMRRWRGPLSSGRSGMSSCTRPPWWPICQGGSPKKGMFKEIIWRFYLCCKNSGRQTKVLGFSLGSWRV